MENKVDPIFQKEYEMAELITTAYGWTRENPLWEKNVNQNYQKLIKDQRWYALYGMKIIPREYAMAELMAMKCGWKREDGPWESQVNLHYQKLIKDQRMYAAFGMRIEVIA